MENKNSYEVTNPVFNTAKMTSFFLAESGNKYAKALIERTGFDKELAYKDNPAMQVLMLPNLIGQDVRYEAINRLIRKYGNKNILDFACGFSPRGLEFAKEGYTYHGGDLQMVVPVIEPVIKELAGDDADRISYYVVDVTNRESCLAAAASFDGPVTVITEGLMPYLNKIEKTTVFSNIAAILKEKGGCYVCPDFNDNRYALSICMTILDEGSLEAVAKTHEQFASKGDSDTEANMTDPKSEAIDILKGLPLAYEFIELYPVTETIHSYSLVEDKDKLANLRKAIASGNMLVARYDAAKDAGTAGAAGKASEFSVNHYASGDRIHIAVSGRMDSITAPEVVDVYSAIENKEEYSTVDFDFANLQYISSAGLRVLLSIKKSIKGDVIIRNASRDVKEVFELSGFDTILVVE